MNSLRPVRKVVLLLQLQIIGSDSYLQIPLAVLHHQPCNSSESFVRNDTVTIQVLIPPMSGASNWKWSRKLAEVSPVSSIKILAWQSQTRALQSKKPHRSRL